jgi:hypothetical protein
MVRFVCTCDWEPSVGKPRPLADSFSQLKLLENGDTLQVLNIKFVDRLWLKHSRGSEVHVGWFFSSLLSASQHYGGLPTLATAKKRRNLEQDFHCTFTESSNTA